MDSRRNQSGEKVSCPFFGLLLVIIMRCLSNVSIYAEHSGFLWMLSAFCITALVLGCFMYMCDCRLGDYTQEDLNADLHKLSELDPSFIHSVAQDDIDPLLQVQCTWTCTCAYIWEVVHVYNVCTFK